jgi:hypothetical protein
MTRTGTTSLKKATSTQRYYPDSGKRFMTAHPLAAAICGREVAPARPRFGASAPSAQKSTGSRKICGIKATATLPQRETVAQMLA